MDVLRHYVKAISALLVQLVAMGLAWYLTGKFSEAEVVQTVTALVSALLVAFVENGPEPRSARRARDINRGV